MNFAMEDQPLPQLHYDFRAGHWWTCLVDDCDGVHHYYVQTPQPV